MRDTGRGDVYAAEDLAFDGTVLAHAPGGEALATATRTVIGSTWWQLAAGSPGGGGVRRVRVREAGDSHWAPGSGTIALDPGDPWYVVSHELAHVVAGAAVRGRSAEPAHGPRWRGWNVAVVAAVFGDAFAALLTDAWRRHALVVTPAPVTARSSRSPLVDVSATMARRGGWRPGR